MGSRAALMIRTCQWAGRSQCRRFSTQVPLSSGHNRWSKIKHDKAKEDASKSKERTLLSYEVFLASKYGGGPDPALNSRLATAITNAKKGALNKASIEQAIAKGQGRSPTGAQLEDVTIEAMLPNGVAAVIEYQTDSKARVLQDARSIIRRAGGNVTPTSFLFEKKGRLYFNKKDDVGVDDVLDEAIEAGAMDVDDEDGQLVIDTDPSAVTSLGQKLEERFGLKLDRSEIFYDPKPESLVELGEVEIEELNVIVGLIEEDPGLQNIYMNTAN